MTKKCSTCIWWLPIDENITGECRRYPPIATGDPGRYFGEDITLNYCWPVTKLFYWCGEHRPHGGEG